MLGAILPAMTILFIDDDPDDIELFCEAVDYLNASEFFYRKYERMRCLTSPNCSAALALLKQLDELPKYIFMDINMPVMDGRECLQALKSNPVFSAVSVIMLSTTLREKDVQEFQAMGAIDCIVKPSGFNALVKVLAKYVYNI